LSTTNEKVGELNKEIQNRIVPGAITQKIRWNFKTHVLTISNIFSLNIN
jgi:hypothetical protein